MIRTIIGWFFVLWTGLAMQAQNFLAPGSTEYRVLESLHRFDYARADSLIISSRSHISPAEYHFLRVNYYWWLWISSPGRSDFRDSLVYHLDRTDELLPQTDRPSEKNYYIRLMNYGFRYRLAFKEDRFVSGLIYAQKTANRIRYALDHAGDSPFLKLTAAIYLFSTGYGEREYWYLKPYFLLIPDGDMELGLRYLEELTRHPNAVLADEARYVLMRIRKDILHRPGRALPLIEELVRRHPRNLFYRALMIRIKQDLSLPVNDDIRRYAAIFRQTVFRFPQRRKFYSDWRNII